MMMMMLLNLVYKGLANSLTLEGCPLLRRQPDLHHLHTQYTEPNFLQAVFETARVTDPLHQITTASNIPALAPQQKPLQLTYRYPQVDAHQSHQACSPTTVPPAQPQLGPP